MKYVLAVIAGIWMADGVLLLVAPGQIMGRLREALALSPNLLKWELMVALLGLVLVLGTRGIHFEALWVVVGIAMIAKGLFLAVGPAPSRQRALDWCLQREDVDYRFVGLGLCTLALLLLHALGWLGNT